MFIAPLRTLRLLPRINLLNQPLHGRHSYGIEILQRPSVNGHADAPRAGVDYKGRLEQMVELLADFDIEAGVGIFQHDVLLRVEQSPGVKVLACAAGLGDGVDVGPFGDGGAAWGGVPFFAEGVGQLGVGEELEEVLCAVGGAPGVLDFEDVELEVGF